MARENALKYVKENIEKWSEKKDRNVFRQKKKRNTPLLPRHYVNSEEFFRLKMLTHFIASFPEYHDCVPLAPTFRKITVSIMSLSNSSNNTSRKVKGVIRPRWKYCGGGCSGAAVNNTFHRGPKQQVKAEETQRATDLSSSGTAFRQVR
jgi:hypothetical protein